MAVNLSAITNETHTQTDLWQLSPRPLADTNSHPSGILTEKLKGNVSLPESELRGTNERAAAADMKAISQPLWANAEPN